MPLLPDFVNKVVWNIHSFPYYLLSRYNSTVVVTETEWPTKSKIFTI